MSDGGGSPAVERQAFQALEAAVGRTLDEVASLRERLDGALARQRELERRLRGFVEGDEDPVALGDELRLAREENRDMRERMERGREAVERLLARIRYLEEQR